MNAVCAILAAGASSRMGEPKALLRIGNRTLLDRAIAATGGRRTALVTSGAIAKLLHVPAEIQLVVNDAPQRGMSHSLHLANVALGQPDAPLVVLLVDTPFVDAGLVDRVVSCLESRDVAYPVCAGVPGHPVVFGTRARMRIAALPPGDTLRFLRDDPELQRSLATIEDDAPFADVDTPEDVRRIGA